jgi:hypothetical protein
MRSPAGRFMSACLALIAAFAWSSTPAHAATDLLTPPATETSTTYLTDVDDFPAWRLIPSTSAVLSSVTATYDQTTASGYRILVYTNAVDRPGSIIGELTQSSTGSLSVQFSGCVPMLAGNTYWVGFQGSTSGVTAANVRQNTGSQTSTWQWDTAGSNQARVQSGGSAVFPASGFPRATLAGTVASDPVCASDSGGSEDSLTAPAPILQQFGMPEVGTCDSAQPADLDWFGVSRGGWGMSWAQWMNAGDGGPVCTRQLEFTSGRWVVH